MGVERWSKKTDRVFCANFGSCDMIDLHKWLGCQFAIREVRLTVRCKSTCACNLDFSDWAAGFVFELNFLIASPKALKYRNQPRISRMWTQIKGIPSIIGIKRLIFYPLLLESGDERASQLTVMICSKASGFLEYPADPPSCSIVFRISSFLQTNINDIRKRRPENNPLFNVISIGRRAHCGGVYKMWVNTALVVVDRIVKDFATWAPPLLYLVDVTFK